MSGCQLPSNPSNHTTKNIYYGLAEAALTETETEKNVKDEDESIVQTIPVQLGVVSPTCDQTPEQMVGEVLKGQNALGGRGSEQDVEESPTMPVGEGADHVESMAVAPQKGLMTLEFLKSGKHIIIGDAIL